jgi:membrane protease YdiL (CAAX protease family)
MGRVATLWQGVPVVVRAVVVGTLVTGTATLPWSVLAGANFKLRPSIPWSVPVMAVYLWAYWRYVGGKGWPASTAESRRRDLRARSLSGPVWRWSLLAGSLGVASLLALRVAFESVLAAGRECFPDVSAYPSLTVASIIAMASAVAGVAEEAGFRGYMQGPIERRHGPVVAVLVVGTLFWLAHFTHYIGQGWVFLGLFWYFLGAAAVYGALAYLTGSILPGVVLHALGNVLGFGVLWWASSSAAPAPRTGGGGGRLAFACALAGLVSTASMVWAYRRLAVVARREAPSAR